MNYILLLLLLAQLLAGAVSEGQDTMPTIEEVKAKYEQQLLQVPAVVSVGIGLNQAGAKVIVVGLARPAPESAAKLPATLDSYPVRVEVIGTPQAR